MTADDADDDELRKLTGVRNLQLSRANEYLRAKNSGFTGHTADGRRTASHRDREEPRLEHVTCSESSTHTIHVKHLKAPVCIRQKFKAVTVQARKTCTKGVDVQTHSFLTQHEMEVSVVGFTPRPVREL